MTGWAEKAKLDALRNAIARVEVYGKVIGRGNVAVVKANDETIHATKHLAPTSKPG